ncbi:hypothetical protein EJ04DRAFT_79945 [Polyplosphaeria fusca]|uniref:Uncharacterized protein n=1 Tax=Polyplosphaeria fusca TaxID=682080 RepID=A0A9P4R6P4_9PLEO|nr:hypothetical protein EJ04DRAFT_79945 [Polyplosphaeria fusca]
MAPMSEVDAAAQQEASPAPNYNSLESWLAIYGNEEYVSYKSAANPPHLSYDGWASSEHALSAFFYRLTLDTWDLISSSDDDDEEDGQPVTMVSPRFSAQQSTKMESVNGNGTSHAMGTPVTSAKSKPQEVSTSTKRRGGRKKKVRSASPSHEEDVSGNTPGAEATTPSTRNATPDGSATSSATRRGLRVRTPAQQRPYYHHAKFFEGEEVADHNQGPVADSSSKSKASSLANVVFPDASDRLIDEQSQVGHMPARKKKFNPKEKGRPWKKDDEDEDEDYAELVEQPVSIDTVPKKKRGRPKKRQTVPAPGSHDELNRTQQNWLEESNNTASKANEIHIDSTPQSKSKKRGNPSVAHAPTQDEEQLEGEEGKKSARAPRRKARKSAAIISPSDDETEDEPLVEGESAADPDTARKTPRRRSWKSAAMITASDDETTDGDPVVSHNEIAGGSSAVQQNIQPPKTTVVDTVMENEQELGQKIPPPVIGNDEPDHLMTSTADATAFDLLDMDTDSEKDIKKAAKIHKMTSKKTGKSPIKGRKARQNSDSDVDFNPGAYYKKKFAHPTSRGTTRKSTQKVEDESEAEMQSPEGDQSRQNEEANVSRVDQVGEEAEKSSPARSTRKRKSGSNASEMSQ